MQQIFEGMPVTDGLFGKIWAKRGFPSILMNLFPRQILISRELD
jgi:hypothetical protein